METKLKFKVGDKVRVKSLEWYNNSKNISGEIILKIEKVKNGYYYVVTNGWKWYDWMLEDEVVTEENSKDKRIEPNEILAIKIKEEKPKFDPQTLQDFQKVLYRSSNADWWKLGFFDSYNNIQNKKFWIVGQNSYEQCVPYNEETEKLKGKILDAPDYYKNW